MRQSVLLVESDPGVRGLLGIQLRLRGSTVRVAASGRLGVAAFAAYRREIAVVVSGELGPPLDGADLLAAVREADPDVPVCFFLAHSLPPEILCRPGVSVFLKPDGAGALCRAVGDLMVAATPA